MTPEEPCVPFLSPSMTVNSAGGLDDPVDVVLCRCMPVGHELPYPHEGMLPF